MNRRGGLVEEALRNLASRTGLTTALILLLAVGTCAAFVTELNTTTALDAIKTNLVAGGYSTMYLERDQPDAPAIIDTSTCERINELPGVIGTMWLGEPLQLQLWSQTGPGLTVRPAGGDVLVVLASLDATRASGWTGEQLLLDPDSPVARGASRAFTVDVVSPVRRSLPAYPFELNGLGSGVQAGGLVLTYRQTAARVTACLALVRTRQRDFVRTSLRASFPPGDHFQARWGLANSGIVDDPVARFAGRPSQYAWLIVTAFNAAVIALYLFVRRADRAFYATLGLGLGRLRRLVMYELLTLAIAALAVSFVACWCCWRRVDPQPDVTAAAWRSYARAALASVSVLAVCGWYETRRTATTTLRILKDR